MKKPIRICIVVFSLLLQAAFSYAANSAPTVGTITPASGSSTANQAVDFTTTYSDPDGWQNLQYAFMIINYAASGASCPYVYYNQNLNRLYIMNDAATNWIGGFAPGSSNIIENSFAKIDCSKTSVTGSGTTMTVKWNITLKAPFTGANKTYLYASDDTGVTTGWIQKGTWTTPNVSPQIGALSPSSGTMNANQEYAFTSIYTDGDGYLNIRYAYIMFNGTLTSTESFYGYYDRPYNRLYLYDSSTSKYLGGFTPGSNNVITTPWGKLNCANTTVSGSGNTLTINWAITFYTTSAGTRKAYMNMYDLACVYSGWIQKGTVTIPNNAPTVGTVSPASGSVNINQEHLFTATYNDPDGYLNTSSAYLLFNNSVSTVEGVYLYYYRPSNLMYLYDASQSKYLGGYAPGSNNTVETSWGKLSFKNSSVSGSGNTLTVNWAVTFKAMFTGTKNSYLYVSDIPGSNSGWTQKGTIALPNKAPILGALTPSSGTSNPAQAVDFTANYADADGWQNIQQAYVLINSTLTGANACYAYYSHVLNRLYLINDSGTASLGGFTPASANTIENSFVKLDCSKTTVTGSGNNLAIKWNFAFKAPFAGTRKVYTLVKDDANAATSWVQKGTWTIIFDNTPPVGTISINNGAKYTSNAGVILALLATDSGSGMGAGSQMRVSNDGSAWSDAEAYRNTKTWILSSGDGQKTVYAKFKDVAGNWSDAYSSYINLDTIPPTAPDGLLASNGDAVVDLLWLANSEQDLAGYNIYRSINAGSGYVKLNNSLINTTNYHDDGLINEKIYYYKIAAVDCANNEGAYSKEIIAMPSNVPRETEPNNDFASADLVQLNSYIKGAINSSDDEDYYKITATESGVLGAALTSSPNNIDIYIDIYDSKHNNVGSFYRVNNGNIIVLQQRLASAGDYYIVIYGWSYDNGPIPYLLEANFSTAGIYNVSVQPYIFRPEEGTTTISALITVSSNWTVNIKNSAGNIVRTFTGTSSTINRVWDGKDSSGVVVPDGIDTYNIDAVSVVDGLSLPQVSGTIIIDSTLPTASITEPLSNTTLSGIVNIKGVSDDLNFYQANLFSGEGNPPFNWIYIKSISGKIGPAPGLLATWDTTACSNGDYVLILEVHDQAGNINTTQVPVKVYNAICNIQVTPGYISPNNDGIQDAATFAADISSSNSWAINIKNSTGVIKRTFTGSSSAINEIWDGKDSLGVIVPDGVYIYTVDEVNPTTGSIISQVQGQIIIDTTLPQVSISEPILDATLSGTVDIKGIADDLNFFYSSLYCPQYYASNDSRVGPSPGPMFTIDSTRYLNGDYLIALEVYDKAGNMNKVELPVKFHNISIYDFYSSPYIFSPNADNSNDTAIIIASLTAAYDWTVIIKDSNDDIKNAFTGNSLIINQIWDGKDSLGAVVPDGIYTYAIDATDPVSGTSAPQVLGTITVDNTPPQASITEPIPGAILSGTIDIKGVADDLNFSYGYLYYGQGILPTDWTYIGSTYQVGPDPELLDVWNTTCLSNGDYVLRLEVYDYAQNNMSRTDQTVKLYNVNIYGMNISNYVFSPNSDNHYDETTIAASLNAAYDWVINIKDSSSIIKRTFAGTSSTIEQIWDGKDSLGAIVPDDTYICTLNATDPASGASAPLVSSDIIVDNTVPQASITEPRQGAILSGTVNVTGIANDLNFSRAELYYGRGISPNNWNYVNTFYRTYGDDGSDFLIPWNTAKFPNGNGDYVLRLEVYDNAGNMKRVERPVVLYNINVFSFSVSSAIFSPNADHDIDTTTIFAYLSASYVWTINVRDSRNNIKRTFTGIGSTINQVWDGKDSLGMVCHDGVYVYTIDVTDPVSGAAAPQVSGIVMIDNTPPQASVVEPLPGTILSGIVNMKCFADDLNISSVCFYYGNGASPTAWIRTAIANRIGSSSEFLASWNTATCPNGEGVLRLVAYDNACNNKVVDLPVSLYNVNILSFTVSPYIFSANTRGMYDAVTITSYFTAAYSWIVNIADCNSTIKRAFSGSSSSVNQVWDGKDSSGTLVSDGNYTFTINATDPLSGLAVPQASQTVIVDNTLPEAGIIEPLPNASISGVIDIKGIADDLHFSSAYLYYGKGVLPTTWNPIGSIAAHNPGLLATWDTTTLSNGDYVLRLEVYDYAVNKRVVDAPVQISNKGPDINNLIVIPNPFSPDESGTWIDRSTGEIFNDPGPNRILDDIAAISFTVSAPGFFDIKILDSSGELIRQLVYSALSPDPMTHKIELQWNGCDNNGAVLKNGQYKLVVNAGSVEKEKSIMIVIDKKPFITGATVTPNPFSPNNDGSNDETAVSYSISEDAYVTVEVYSSQNNIVRTLVNNQLLASGNHSHIFNGKSDLGDNLPEGRYTIKINAKAEAGNAGDPVYVNVSMLFISDIRISTDTINPYSGERASIIYQIGTDSILSIKIYDSANVLVRNLISNQSRAPGTYSEDWDGKDDSGQIVRDGPYYFIIEDIMSGSLIVVYDPRGTGGRDISHSISFSATNFNPLLNQFSILDYNMPQAAKINIKVRSQRFSGPAVKVIKYQEPVSRGSHQVLWDGRDEAGNFVDMKAYTFAIWGYTLDENSIVVTGGRPVISNLSLNLVRFSPYDNPYSLNISQNTISFNLSKNANVTINIYGSGGTLFRALLVNQLCVQGANSFIWDGKDSAGNLAIDDNYRVMMQAEKDGNYSEAYMLHSEICY